MNRLVLLMLAMLLAVASAQAGITLRDDIGVELRLPHPAQRIIALAPHATELLFAAGAGAKLIATVEFSDYPEEARRLQHVGGYETLDVERIVALRPDLVVAWGAEIHRPSSTSCARSACRCSCPNRAAWTT